MDSTELKEGEEDSMTTDTPRTDAARIGELERELQSISKRLANMTKSRDCMIEDRNLLEVEVKRLKDVAYELCREREAHNKTREDLEQLNIAGATAVQAAKLFKLRAEKAEAENVCLQELMQAFYEWSRRDYPTEAEVRDIMNRYYNLLNK
jgi:regulator of replication initiation timing